MMYGGHCGRLSEPARVSVHMLIYTGFAKRNGQNYYLYIKGDRLTGEKHELDKTPAMMASHTQFAWQVFPEFVSGFHPDLPGLAVLRRDLRNSSLILRPRTGQISDGSDASAIIASAWSTTSENVPFRLLHRRGLSLWLYRHSLKLAR